MDSKRTGVIAIIGCSLMWAIEAVLAKKAYASAGVLQTAATRVGVASVTGLLYVLLTKPKRIFGVTKRDLSALLYIALVGTVLADLLYLYALTEVPILNAVLIAHLQPIFIVIIGFLLPHKDKLTGFDCLGILTMIIAGLLVTTSTLENLLNLKFGTAADLYVVLATLSWATASIVAKNYISHVDAAVITFYRFLLSALALTAYVSMTSALVVSNAYQVILGITTGIGFILFYEGLKRIKAAQAAALELTSPFFATVLGFMWLQEIPTVMQLLGVVTVFLGIHFLSKRENVHRFDMK